MCTDDEAVYTDGIDGIKYMLTKNSNILYQLFPGVRLTITISKIKTMIWYWDRSNNIMYRESNRNQKQGSGVWIIYKKTVW